MTTTNHFVTIAPTTAPLATDPADPADPAATVRLFAPPPLMPRLAVTISLPIWALTVLPGILALALALVAIARVEPMPAAATAFRTASPTPPIRVPTGAPAAPAGPALPVSLIAYAEPNGAPLGALPAGRAYTILAEAYGGAWLQLDAGSGPVWVAAAQWGAAPILRAASLADLTPPTPTPPSAPMAAPALAPQAAHVAPAPATLLAAPLAEGGATCLDAAQALCHRDKPARPRP